MKDNSGVQIIGCSRCLMGNQLLNECLCHLWSLIDGKDFDKNIDKSL